MFGFSPFQGGSHSNEPRHQCAGENGGDEAVTPHRYVRRMPRISAFYGIVIVMYFGDHVPPHFHARYGDHEAQVLIATGEVLHGSLPRRALKLVQEWAELHRDDLIHDWELARREQPLDSIAPLP